MSLYAIPYTRRFAPNFLRVANWLDRNFSESCQLFAFFFSLIGYINALIVAQHQHTELICFSSGKQESYRALHTGNGRWLNSFHTVRFLFYRSAFIWRHLSLIRIPLFAVILSHFKGWREKGKGICICQIRLRSGEKKTLPTDKLTKQLDKG